MTALYRLQEDADLSARNSFGVRARAPWLLDVHDSGSLGEALDLPQIRELPLLPIGGGSNLLFAADAPGLVLRLRGRDVGILDDDGTRAIVRAEAGLPWHDLVLWSLEQGLYGLENLALIPGDAGAAPIQNIGAYGTEVGEFVHAVQAWDRADGRLRRLDRAACAFGYRDSVFKRQPDRFLVTALELALPRHAPLRTGYAGIADELAAMRVDAPTPRDVAEAVIRIRQRKLPDPAVIGNAGSFFKNPIVSSAQAQALRQQYPALPVFAAGEGRSKLSAAWLIETAGWKGAREGDAGVSDAHALVLVNHGQASGAQLLALARRIAASVRERFGVALEPEPRLVGAQW